MLNCPAVAGKKTDFHFWYNIFLSIKCSGSLNDKTSFSVTLSCPPIQDYMRSPLMPLSWKQIVRYSCRQNSLLQEKTDFICHAEKNSNCFDLFQWTLWKRKKKRASLTHITMVCVLDMSDHIWNLSFKVRTVITIFIYFFLQILKMSWILLKLKMSRTLILLKQ